MGRSLAVVWKNLYRNEKLLSAAGQIRTVMHRDVPLASLRRCAKSCYLDKSNRIDVETCSAFQCVALSSNLFRSVSFDDTEAQWNTEHVSVPVRFDLFRQRRKKQLHSDATNTCFCITIRFAPRLSAFYYTIWFVQAATYDTSTQWSN